MRVREPAVGFCGPQRPPGGEARDVGLCPNHAVLRFLQLGLLGGRVVLRILTLVVEYHRAVMKIVLAGPHCAVFHLCLPRLHGLFQNRPRQQFQIGIARLTQLGILAGVLQGLQILTS